MMQIAFFSLRFIGLADKMIWQKTSFVNKLFLTDYNLYKC